MEVVTVSKREKILRWKLGAVLLFQNLGGVTVSTALMVFATLFIATKIFNQMPVTAHSPKFHRMLGIQTEHMRHDMVG